MTEQSIPLPDEAASKRRMPDNLRRFLLRMPGNKAYLPAAYRVVWFRDECPDWGIETKMIEGGQADGFATVQATIRNAEGRIIAQGTKTETKADFPAGWVEKAETGSVARALSLAGFGTQFAPELDDAESAGRIADSPQDPRGNYGMQAQSPTSLIDSAVWDGPGACPSCHAPAGKRHATTCRGTAQNAQAAGR